MCSWLGLDGTNGIRSREAVIWGHPPTYWDVKTLAWILCLLSRVVYPGLRWLFNYCVWLICWIRRHRPDDQFDKWFPNGVMTTQRPPLPIGGSGLSLHIDVLQCKLWFQSCQWLDKVIATESATQRSCASLGGNKKEAICARLWPFVVYKTLSAPERLFPVRIIPHQPTNGGLVKYLLDWEKASVWSNPSAR